MWQLKSVLQKSIFSHAYFIHKTSCSFNIEQDRKLLFSQGLTSYLLRDSGLSWGLSSKSLPHWRHWLPELHQLLPSFCSLNSAFYYVKSSYYLLVFLICLPHANESSMKARTYWGLFSTVLVSAVLFSTVLLEQCPACSRCSINMVKWMNQWGSACGPHIT